MMVYLKMWQQLDFMKMANGCTQEEKIVQPEYGTWGKGKALVDLQVLEVWVRPRGDGVIAGYVQLTLPMRGR